ncbi:MAG: hypothetical protein B6226_00530 [Candidatus Cloacimonetes bacterium 4572_65]|nr:MAG: hypothetical protein B6226_00530 [Candidatus Cloacimonetes bacterium 4572_65]
MAKFMKRLFWIGSLSALGYFGFQLYKRVTAVSKLSKSLPEFLNNVYGEKPKVSINFVITSLTLRVGFTLEVMNANEDITSTITEYIEDFYPSLNKANVKIDVFTVETSTPGTKTTEEEKPSEDCNCDCDEHAQEECDCDGDCKSSDEPAEEIVEEEAKEVEETK